MLEGILVFLIIDFFDGFSDLKLKEVFLVRVSGEILDFRYVSTWLLDLSLEFLDFLVENDWVLVFIDGNGRVLFLVRNGMLSWDLYLLLEKALLFFGFELGWALLCLNERSWLK